MESAIEHGLSASAHPVDLRTALAGRDMTDSDLLVAIGAGNRKAFEELYRRFSRPVLGMALSRLNDRGKAEDAVQEAFASIWRSAATYRPERGPGAPWVYTVARNAVTSRWREQSDIPVEPWDEASPEAGPEEHAEQAWRAFRVHRALERLPREQRSLIELAYWGDLSQSEIAERLQIPLGTVKTRTRAALAQMADALEEEMR